MRYAPPADATIRVVEGRDRLYINWTAVDADSFAEVKATFRDYFPCRDAVWNPDERAWAIAYHLRPRLERRLGQSDIVKAGQAIARRADHFGSGIDGNDPQIPLREAPCCLAGAAADLEKGIAGLQRGVGNDVVDESLGIVGAGGPVGRSDLIECEALLHGTSRPVRLWN